MAPYNPPIAHYNEMDVSSMTRTPSMTSLVQRVKDSIGSRNTLE